MAFPLAGENLTAREVEVLRLLGQGLSVEQIAAALFVSRRTVETHLYAAYQKLGVRRAHQAVVAGLRLGYIPLSDVMQRAAGLHSAVMRSEDEDEQQ